MIVVFKRECRSPLCFALTKNKSGYCDGCQAKQPHIESKLERRQTAAQRGYNYKWRKARADFLKANPLCSFCKAQGLYVPAFIVDHIKPHKGDVNLFWDRGNWQALCKRCHDGAKQSMERRQAMGFDINGYPNNDSMLKYRKKTK